MGRRGHLFGVGIIGIEFLLKLALIYLAYHKL